MNYFRIDDRPLTLADIGQGKLEKRFKAAMQAVIANIKNDETPVKGKRDIIIKISLEPIDDDRDTMRVVYNVMPPKLIPMEPYKSSLIIEQSIVDSSTFEAYEAIKRNDKPSFMDGDKKVGTDSDADTNASTDSGSPADEDKNTPEDTDQTAKDHTATDEGDDGVDDI